MRPTFLEKKEDKNAILKKILLFHCIEHGQQSISAFSSRIGASIPTTTKLIGELIREGFLMEMGKSETSGGRRAALFGLNPQAGYFIGTDVRHTHTNVAITDFKGNLVSYQENIPFSTDRSEESLREISKAIREYIGKHDLEWNRIMGLGVSIAGRVNPITGFGNSYTFEETRPIYNQLKEDLALNIVLENDSRAITYGEYLYGGLKEKNMLCVNVSWGLGMGMILGGKLYYGKSGYSGEFGHFPFEEQGILCRCGKIGCMETVASCSALERMVNDALQTGKASSLLPAFSQNGHVGLGEIFNALGDEDMLSIEIVERIGENLGKGIAGLINIFNPELVIVSGRLASAAGDYLMLPIRSSVNRHVLNIANKDTRIEISTVGDKAAAVGAALLVRSRMLGIL